jgi:hypothetical protein
MVLFSWHGAKAEMPPGDTTRLAADDPWANERYQLGGGNNSRQANQFGATIGSGAPAATQAPSLLDRGQNAVVGTASTLRDGIESGIKQANNQLNQAGGQIINGTTNTGRELGQQFQNVTGLGSQSQAQSAATWPAPPPALSTTSAAQSSAPTTRPTSSAGWTSIRSDMAPPTLLAPPLTPLSNSATGNFSSTTGAGPSFPPAAPPNNSASSTSNNGSPQRDQFHSVLADPTSASRQNAAASTATGQSAAKSPDWSSGWGNTAPNQATIGRTNDNTIGSGNNSSSSTLPRVGPGVPRQTTGGFATDTDPWNRTAPAATSNNNPARGSPATAGLSDRYNQPAAPSQNGANLWADLPSQSTAPSANAPQASVNNQPGINNQPSTSFSNFPNQQNTGQSTLGQPGLNPSTMGQNVAGQPLLNQPGGNMSTLGFGNQNAMLGQQPMTPDEHPWGLLLVASVSLAGSLGANLFLGWSYADARHRYHLLVRRTTESFHKATGIAA